MSYTTIRIKAFLANSINNMAMPNIPFQPIELQIVNNDDGSTLSIQTVSNKGVVTPDTKKRIPIKLVFFYKPQKNSGMIRNSLVIKIIILCMENQTLINLVWILVPQKNMIHPVKAIQRQ